MAIQQPRHGSKDSTTAAAIRTPPPETNDDLSGRTWAREVPEDPWDPAILALDGGGIRGYASLLILQKLMHEIAEWERRLDAEEMITEELVPRPSHNETLLPDGNTRPEVVEDELRPCHYFDYMYGTSTGGLIATLLGRLRLTVPQCLEAYREVGDDLFGTKRSTVPFATKYDHKPLERAVKDIVKKYCLRHDECDGGDWNPWNMEDGWEEGGPTDRICQTICLTATHNGKIDEAYLLRTYPHYYPDGTPNWITLYNEGADPLRIWQVTRATSAAPFFFNMLEADVRGEIVGFKDGGIRENNPSGAAWSEFISMYGADAEPAALLSIGTGRPPAEVGDGFASAWPGPLGNSRVVRKAAEKFAVVRNVLIKYTEGEKQHEAMRNVARGENRWYKRMNVMTGMEGMKLDDWRRGEWTDPSTGITTSVPGGASLTRMEKAVKALMERPYDPRHDSYAPPSVLAKQTAEKLVRMRRAREKAGANGDKRWDSFVGKTLKELGKPVQHVMEGSFPDPELPQLPKVSTQDRIDGRPTSYLRPDFPRSTR
ncbi:MAG: hypothetical protein M1820_003910 [Bogoriella megaspora]|nr:MAG: hypothetical protein M1820_003910 [Bogoriella megaspora]